MNTNWPRFDDIKWKLKFPDGDGDDGGDDSSGTDDPDT